MRTFSDILQVTDNALSIEILASRKLNVIKLDYGESLKFNQYLRAIPFKTLPSNMHSM